MSISLKPQAARRFIEMGISITHFPPKSSSPLSTHSSSSTQPSIAKLPINVPVPNALTVGGIQYNSSQLGEGSLRPIVFTDDSLYHVAYQATHLDANDVFPIGISCACNGKKIVPSGIYYFLSGNMQTSSPQRYLGIYGHKIVLCVVPKTSTALRCK